ncbi:MAG TPA: apolipoprotein N-acyltransferase [Candidatus Eremiobacteraceae bacterium]
MSAVTRELLLGSPTPARAGMLLRLGLAIVPPLALSMAYPKLDASALALVSLAPLFWSWSKSSWKRAFLDGWLSGTIFFFVMCFWMTNSLGDYIGEWKLLAGVLLAALEGLSFAGVGALTSLICQGEIGATPVFALPSAWLLVESVRTRGASGVPFGELGLVGAHTQWLLPVAAFGGVYAMSAIIALCNSALLGIVAGSRNGRIAGVVAIASIVVLVGAADLSRARVAVDPPSVRVAVAQGGISQREKWSPAVFEHTMAVYSDLTHRAAAQGARVIVWPETAITSNPLQNPSLLAYLERLASANDVWLIAGAIDRPQEDTLYNSVLEISPSGAFVKKYDKHILVPFAEYLPFEHALRGVPLFGEASHFSAGTGPALFDAAGVRFGPLVCYESAFAPYAREIANAGAGALIVVTDDAWFGDTSGPYQHAEMSIVDAVETGRWLVRGGDTGISEIIDPKGRVVESLGLDTSGVLAGEIGAPVDAPYVRWGIWWLLVIAGATLAWGLYPRRRIAHGWRSRRGYA